MPWNEMSEAIEDESEAINSIYGEGTLRKSSDGVAFDNHVLTVPSRGVALRLSIPKHYPNVCIEIVAVEGVGSNVQKGYGNHVLIEARDILKTGFIHGQVCLFDVLQELGQRLDQDSTAQNRKEDEYQDSEDGPLPIDQEFNTSDAPDKALFVPQWALSSTITEKKSVFLARACTVKSTAEVDLRQACQQGHSQYQRLQNANHYQEK
ncbi:MAG: hypothetical protein Q9218_008262 [Villophora microphyllina]